MKNDDIAGIQNDPLLAKEMNGMVNVNRLTSRMKSVERRTIEEEVASLYESYASHSGIVEEREG